MFELNPYRMGARIFALMCYVLAGLVIVMGSVFTFAAASVDVSKLPIKPGRTNLEIAIFTASPFLVLAVIAVSLGWQIQSLYGRRFLGNKLVARSTVGCLRTGGIGCGVWILLSAFSSLAIGYLPITFEPISPGEAFFFTLPLLMVCGLILVVAWFISIFFTKLNEVERQAVYANYLSEVKARLHKMGEPAARAYVEELTFEVLEKLDPRLKRLLLWFLAENNLLNGLSGIQLRGSNFSRVDLRSIRLPRADLSEIDLTDATLADAILYGVNLKKAKLKGVDLTRANLQDANLWQADLTGSVLDETNLIGVDLSETKVSEAQLRRARRN